MLYKVDNKNRMKIDCPYKSPVIIFFLISIELEKNNEVHDGKNMALSCQYTHKT